jgi:hypothetical protein
MSADTDAGGAAAAHPRTFGRGYLLAALIRCLPANAYLTVLCRCCMSIASSQPAQVPSHAGMVDELAPRGAPRANLTQVSPGAPPSASGGGPTLVDIKVRAAHLTLARRLPASFSPACSPPPRSLSRPQVPPHSSAPPPPPTLPPPPPPNLPPPASEPLPPPPPRRPPRPIAAAFRGSAAAVTYGRFAAAEGASARRRRGEGRSGARGECAHAWNQARAPFERVACA